ncbi:RNA-directed DNA methylation 4 isoform X2 [Rhododendron vialii]|uniref:RNA-directed DNA methylation 4 isoform X2 n=1 Tax=Rhododendron vialii TaxID=182163 RepID=UPI00266059E7|nr:RNA-directed DNA methylation 4 isoform X2 [Rhododendron vialii]
MADMATSSSTPSEDDKPVIVRVKRKASQSPLEAFWLEINERPLKRPLLDLEKLSISDSSGKEALKSKKVLVQHVETTSSSEDTVDVLQLLVPKPADGCESKARNEEQRRTFTTENKQDQLRGKARVKQEVLSKNARFEQIWRSRKGKKEAMHDDALHEMCHVYDVVRVDVEEATIEVHDQEDSDLEDHRIMSSYLPLLREFIPSAAEEVESDIHDYMSNRASKDEYVYDLYAVKEDNNTIVEGTSNPFPLVQVDEDNEFYAGPIASDNESDDSNAEDNPMNDYPDEETSEDNEDSGSSTSKDESEENEDSEMSASKKSSEPEDSEHQSWLEEADPMYEDYIYGGDEGDGEGEAYYDKDEGSDNDYWKWSYR